MAHLIEFKIFRYPSAGFRRVFSAVCASASPSLAISRPRKASAWAVTLHRPRLTFARSTVCRERGGVGEVKSVSEQSDSTATCSFSAVLRLRDHRPRAVPSSARKIGSCGANREFRTPNSAIVKGYLTLVKAIQHYRRAVASDVAIGGWRTLQEPAGHIRTRRRRRKRL